MENVISRLKLRKAEMERLGLLSPEAEALLNDMMDELERLEKQNDSLRRSLRSSSKTPRMSSKLKDALYE
ncbi:hypothetical protein OIN60_08050 [Paenibacillus sp. P96]|uniref:Ni2+-binding GTPase n=1 Tax=Paenibacillus zeirhizosphaerae TaxID=2987519 RepID=A0ABT9FPS3_9BACL|nr:hypothetical protein [Paenibacillus sp. P96]MDP4096722.1 hypothetical protein [Paenibacillus sp. P96]